MKKTQIEIPDLLEIQREPYERFLQKDISPGKGKIAGLEQILKKVFPIESDDRVFSLEYLHYTVEDPVEDEFESLTKGITYAGRLKVKFRLVKRRRNEPEKIEKVKEQDVYLGLIPLMTERGTFIINGIERAIVNQLQRSPGVYFKEEENFGQITLYSARILPARGLWMEFYVDNHNCLIVFLGKKKILGTVILKALGYSDPEIYSLFYPDPTKIPAESIIRNAIEKCGNMSQDEALLEIYQGT